VSNVSRIGEADLYNRKTEVTIFSTKNIPS